MMVLPTDANREAQRLIFIPRSLGARFTPFHALRRVCTNAKGKLITDVSIHIIVNQKQTFLDSVPIVKDCSVPKDEAACVKQQHGVNKETL